MKKKKKNQIIIMKKIKNKIIIKKDSPANLQKKNKKI